LNELSNKTDFFLRFSGETDEHDAEDFNFVGEEQLELRVTKAGSAVGAMDRSKLAPQAMQLAVRVRTKTTNRASNGGFIYIDPTSLRCTAAPGAAVAAPASNEPVTMGATASALSRAFGIVVRQARKKSRQIFTIILL
jgi:E3 ubiquitin-protein ligase EDD1